MGYSAKSMRARLMIGAAVSALVISASPALAQEAPRIELAPQSLASALYEFGRQTGHQVIFSPDLTKAKTTQGVSGALDEQVAMAQLLTGTGLTFRHEGNTFMIVRADADPQSGSAAGDGADQGTVQALIVTAQKREENIQDVPIAISAFTQEDLTRSQVAGGPDLMTQVPNFTFTKTNFSSYSIQIRGIGTQAISATTDAAVAVAENNTPFIRNRFFEQEFYDLQRVEVLRGPQGTLYGRNATAGVVNIITQKPKFIYESRLSLDVGNFNSHRLEGMLNIPLADDKVALRIAGAWTKRDGYDTNQITGNQIDGRDLWSTRVSLRFTPTDALDVNLIWEHFQENDDRLRSGKQLCHQDDRTQLGPLTVAWGGYADIYSQGCLPASLYSPDSFEAPNGAALPYYEPFGTLGLPVRQNFNPYASLVQSPDLRVIESTIDPKYRAKDDTVELQASLDLGDHLTLTSETAYLYDTIYSLEDYNRFNTQHGAFDNNPLANTVSSPRVDFLTPGPFGGIFCDPQLGCSDRLVAVDVSRAKSSQFSQEFRVSSNYDGPFNFSLGANFLRYDTEDKYYVFINTLTMLGASSVWDHYANGTYSPWQPGVTDNRECFAYGFQPADPTMIQHLIGCRYIDPNPIESVNDQGHNYFLSRNPFKLISYAVFGEAYYNLTDDLKLTAGLRWTVDKKEAPRLPSMLTAADSVGLTRLNVQEQEWREPTGRLAIDWKPDLSFTDQTLVYASYAHGYKAGGSNPPPSSVVAWAFIGGTSGSASNLLDQSVAKPKTFNPEFVDAFEMGAKNTLLDGRLTLNMAGFYYDYTGYQVSQIIDRSAVNYNFDAKVWGLELEADWRPLENLRLGFKGGYENTRIADGEKAIDIMNRTYGHGPDSADPWLLIRPFPTYPSNCVLPLYVFNRGDGTNQTFLRYPLFVSGNEGPCELAYAYGKDPGTMLTYVPNPTLTTDLTGGVVSMDYAASPQGGSNGYFGYPGFNPDHDYGNNHGEGFFTPLGGHELPNAPHFTATVTADYTIPLPSNWLMTLHSDFYYQSEAWTRVFNMPGYDKLKAYTNVNFAAIFSNEDAGWKVMAYVKNVLDRDSITGAFLNSDDSGLTTNVFLNEPRLFGLRVTKEWNGGPWWTGANPNHTGPYPLTVELSGQVQRQDAPYSSVAPDFVDSFSAAIDPTRPQHRDLDWGDGRQVRIIYKPEAASWSVVAGLRYGKANSTATFIHNEEAAGPAQCIFLPEGPNGYQCDPNGPFAYAVFKTGINWSDSSAQEREKHLIADFDVGKDLGLGLFGDSHSTVSAGLRYARFESTTAADMNGIPDWYIHQAWIKYPSHRHQYSADLTANREFKGAGPTVSWEAAQHLLGSADTGHVDLDWSVTGGVLFGKQKTSVNGTYQSGYASGKYSLQVGAFSNLLPPLTSAPVGVAPRSKSVSVPMLDLSLGLSYEIQRVKVGAGYRWERYFNVLDAGYAERKQYDRTFDGPYLKIAVGFGG